MNNYKKIIIYLFVIKQCHGEHIVSERIQKQPMVVAFCWPMFIHV